MTSKKHSTQLSMKNIFKNSKPWASLKDALHGSVTFFWKNIENQLSDYENTFCGVPQGLILGPLLFLVHVNDIPQAVNLNSLLYTDDSCLMFQHKNSEEIEKVLNNDFENICDWFVDNKLSIHFGEDKTKLILFASQRKIKNITKLNIKYQ